MGREAAERAQKKAAADAVEKARRDAARSAQIKAGASGGSGLSDDDGRSHQRKLNDKIWWDNFHRCGSGKC